MIALPACPVVAPLLMAAVLSAVGIYFPRRLLDSLACLTSAFVLLVCLWLMKHSAGSPVVYWFGSWKPDHTFPIGICFTIDPIGAGLAALVALLVLAAFIFSWQYFEAVKSLYHAVMLVFLAGMCGLCLTGDLFNLFVWFELMSAAGVTLCGYKAEETGPLQGALNFAVTNTLGAYLSLTGIALVYAHTGSLNFAEVSASLAAHNPGGWFVPIAFLFVVAGFLVKAAAFPFHFWLADAHAVAPTPVCVLFSGVMVELGLYAVVRIYWAVFALPLEPHGNMIRTLFLIIGSLTAVVGAIECFGQRHLKRLLAFSTISHMGLMIIGFALLLPSALGGAAMYVIGHGMVKANLFICAGILLHRFKSVDEFDLHGKGKGLPWTAMLLFIGALGLAGLPPFANFYGDGMMDDAAASLHLGWLSAIFVFAGALTSGAVLRIGGRIFLGWGETHSEAARGSPKIPMDSETGGTHRHTPATMFVPALLLLVGAIVVAPLTDLRACVEPQAKRMEDGRGYNALVLQGQPLPAEAPIRGEPFPSIWRSIVTVIAAALLALAALFPKALGGASDRVGNILATLLQPLRAIHSGKVGDYVAWFIFGIGAYGAILLFKYR